MVLHLVRGERIDQRELIRRLTELQYTRNDIRTAPRHLSRARRGHRRVPGRIAKPKRCASSCSTARSRSCRSSIRSPARCMRKLPRYTVYPKIALRRRTRDTRARRDRDDQGRAAASGWSSSTRQNKLVEAQRLQQRTQFDLEMMAEIGYCNGIENYSRHLTGAHAGRAAADPVRLPAAGCAAGRRRIARDDSAARRDVQGRPLAQGNAGRVRFPPAVGARQPAAASSRNGKSRAPRTIFVSATPGPYEIGKSQGNVVELVVRPTGLIDPEVEIRPVAHAGRRSARARSTSAWRWAIACWSRR